MGHLMLGCIADDFTGASDAASFLVKGGLKTILYNGIPPQGEVCTADAVVIALKTRTEEVELAVSQSLAAADWLKSQGARQLYIKYCSTFDSTPWGNIGPICDHILEKYGDGYSLLCPSLPVNQRTVEGGILYVGGVPLAETHMRNHPLTPMKDSFLPSLMEAQSKYPCFVVPKKDGAFGEEMIHAQMMEYAGKHTHFYLIPDYVTDEDGRDIVRIFGNASVLTGGSGLMQPLAEALCATATTHPQAFEPSGGKAILVAGSCSVATQKQVMHYLASGGSGILLDVDALYAGTQTADSLWEAVANTKSDSVLLYSSGSGGKANQEHDAHHYEKAALLEATMAALAKKSVDNGVVRIVCAGGETSGAVTKELGYQSFHIGQSIAPGVPVMIPTNNVKIRLVLKSGNFGQEDFFVRTLNAI